MTKSYLTPSITTAREYLNAARARLCGGRPTQQAAGYGVGLLSRLLDRVRWDLDGYEMAELTSVYDTLAVQVADLLGLDPRTAFVGLTVLCDDQNARRLVQDQPQPAAEEERLLRSRLLWITVTYEAAPDRPVRRITGIAYRKDDGSLKSGTTSLEFGYEDLPERVRERMLRTGHPTVRFQLYPVAGQQADA